MVSSETLVSTTAAGLAASVVESTVTYPLEYLKTREQIAIRPLGMTTKFEIPNFTSVFYKGASAFVAGNAIKTVVRFNVYNWATKMMSDGSSTHIAAPQVVIAGMITGIAETMIVVPFESIKTTMIEASALGKGYAKGTLPVPGSEGTFAAPAASNAAASAASTTPATSTPAGSAGGGSGSTTAKAARKIRPQASAAVNSLYPVKELSGLTSTVRFMYQERGLRAFVQGFNPTVWRQVANSGIRFMSYNFFKQLAAPNKDEVSVGMVVGLTGLSGLAEALVTQPIDVVKSKMQTTNGLKIYGNSLLCAYRVVTEEGPKRLWAGLVPRWLRIWLAGGLTFVVYEAANKQLTASMNENPFAWK